MLHPRTFTFLALATLVVSGAQAGLLSPAEDALLEPPLSFERTEGFAGACGGTFLVGAAAVDVTPGVKQPDGSYALWMEPFEDANGNGVYDGPDPLEADTLAEAELFTDENLNGKWDGPFMAGYGHEKVNNEYYVAEAVHDPVWARAVAVTCGSRTVGLVSVDAVGLFRDVVESVRASATDYEHVVVASTHTHDSVDTMGLWGPSLLIDGKDPRTMAHYEAGIVEALAGAFDAREPAAGIQLASGPTRDLIPVAGTVQTDLRDPFVVDDVVVGARFLDAQGDTIATIVNWAPHPETLAGTKSEISSDYAHYLREAIESTGATLGGDYAAPVGGTAVFFSGAVGGMMTTLGAKPLDEAGNPIPDYTYEKAARIGEVAAHIVLSGFEEAPVLDVQAVRLQTRVMNVLADNAFLMALNTLGVLDHNIYVAHTPVGPVGPTGVVAPVPFMRAEVNVISFEAGASRLLQMLTIPGELLPEVALGNPLRDDPVATTQTCFAYNAEKELFNGGREGKLNPATGNREPGFERQLAAKPAYPKEPAFYHMAKAPYVMMLGLANDELGYIVPANDFEPATLAPETYGDGRDRCGDSDHYEETNSASSLLAPAVANAMAGLLDPWFTPANMPKRQGGFVTEDGSETPIPGWDTRGVWIDTSRSSGYEREEDARVVVSIPQGLPGCWGFLNGHGEDVGQEPSEETRGIFVDMDGDCAPSAGDGVVFADSWAFSEGQPHYRP